MIRRPPTSTCVPYTTLFRSTRSLCRKKFKAQGMRISSATFVPLSAGTQSPWWLELTRAMTSWGDISRPRSEEHTSELQSRGHLVCRLLLEKKQQTTDTRETA